MSIRSLMRFHWRKYLKLHKNDLGKPMTFREFKSLYVMKFDLINKYNYTIENR